MSDSSDSTSWTPAVQLDLAHATSQRFQETIKSFREWADKQTLPPFTLQTGWHEVTPQLAEGLLIPNAVNRQVKFKTVQKYAQAMLRGEWKKTGQSMSVNVRGRTEDGQHRLWACYLSGSIFPSIIVCDVPEDPDLFAYIDDCKPRSAADAIYTAGENGLSNMLAQAVKIAWRYDNNAYAILNSPKIRGMTNPEILTYTREHAGLGEMAHTLMGTYGKALSVIGHKGVAAFFSWRVADAYGMPALDSFLVSLGSGALLEEDDPILAVRNRLMGEGIRDDKMKEPLRLALLIKAFNIHIGGAKVGKRGLSLRDNERFPRIETPLAEAAE